MVRGFSSSSTELISKSLMDILVCPLSKTPLRQCPGSNSLISDAIGVSFPVVNEIPCLVPKDGKILGDEEKAKTKSDITAD